MAFLLLGGMMLGTAIVLSEQERDRYVSTRSTMRYLGERGGKDVFFDSVTGVYYTEDAYGSVQRVGTPGHRPHPVDVDRLRKLYRTHNPRNLMWVNFVLTSFRGKEEECFNNVFEKYVSPKKPREPTWGKGVRKSRWAGFEADLAKWKEDKKNAKEAWAIENEKWRRERRNFDAKLDEMAVDAGRQLMRQHSSARGRGNMVRVKIPPNARPGMKLETTVDGRAYQFAVPRNARPGQIVEFPVPVVATAVDDDVPPAIDDDDDAPPPAIGAGGATKARSFDFAF